MGPAAGAVPDHEPRRLGPGRGVETRQPPQQQPEHLLPLACDDGVHRRRVPRQQRPGPEGRVGPAQQHNRRRIERPDPFRQAQHRRAVPGIARQAHHVGTVGGHRRQHPVLRLGDRQIVNRHRDALRQLGIAARVGPQVVHRQVRRRGAHHLHGQPHETDAQRRRTSTVVAAGAAPFGRHCLRWWPHGRVAEAEDGSDSIG